MALRHLRVRVDLAIPLPDAFLGDGVIDAVNSLNPAVKARVMTLYNAIQAAKADAEMIGWEDTVSTKAHVCRHSCGQSCPPDVVI